VPSVDGICHYPSFNPPSPSLRVSGETPDHLSKVQATIRRLVRVSTMLSRQVARTDNDKVALECNEAARRGRDCSPGARVYRDRCAEVSRQNAASRDIPRATPWQQTRFANLRGVDTARRTEAAGLDRPAWL